MITAFSGVILYPLLQLGFPLVDLGRRRERASEPEREDVPRLGLGLGLG